MLNWACKYEEQKILLESDESDTRLVNSSLVINHRKPMPAFSNYQIDINVIKVVRSKTIHLEAAISDQEGTVYAEATSLYSLVDQRLPYGAGSGAGAGHQGSRWLQSASTAFLLGDRQVS